MAGLEEVERYTRERSNETFDGASPSIARRITFPSDRSVGTLRLYGVRFAKAQGVVDVEEGEFVTLICSDLSALEQLGPLDLNSIEFDGLTDNRLTDRDLRRLRGLTGLTNIVVKNAPGITDDGLKWLQPLHRLKWLMLGGSSVTGTGFDALVGLRPSLLWLDDTKVNDAGLASIANFDSLRTLFLDNTAITDSGLSAVSRLPELESLSLAGTRITDDSLRALEKIVGLADLYLQGTAITDRGLAASSGIHRAKFLVLDNCAISDVGLVALGRAAAPNLEHICLYDTRVTFQGIVALRSLQSLRKIEGSSPNCGNAEELHVVRAAMPGIEINFGEP